MKSSVISRITVRRARIELNQRDDHSTGCCCDVLRVPAPPFTAERCNLHEGLCSCTDVNGAILDVYNDSAAGAPLPALSGRTRSLQLLSPSQLLKRDDMKPVPAALLLAAVLLTTHIPLSVCRPRDLSVVDGRGYRKQLLRAGDSAVSYLLGEKLLRYLQQRKPERRSASLNPPPEELEPGPGQEKALWREDEELTSFSKRNEEPPISIDLTFHLLRNMIEMARIENQREQAELNRKYLDEVGK